MPQGKKSTKNVEAESNKKEENHSGAEKRPVSPDGKPTGNKECFLIPYYPEFILNGCTLNQIKSLGMISTQSYFMNLPLVILLLLVVFDLFF